MLRSKVIHSIRNRMIGQGFLEYQTPILTASSPEGARDFLVPSRLHPGKFYALPQAPQQFKQLLMVSGFDRYFQIAPCFRDEDLRADRLPGEFYQLDVEMSFVTQEDVFAAIEPVMHGVFEEFARRQAGDAYPFPRIPYREASPSTAPTSRTCATRSRCRTSPSSSAARASVFAGILEKDPKNARLGDPRAGRRQPRLLRPHEQLGAGRGPAGPRLHLLARGRAGRAGGRPDRQEHRPGARREAIRASSASATATRPSSSPATRRCSTSSPAPRAPRSARS